MLQRERTHHHHDHLRAVLFEYILQQVSAAINNATINIASQLYTLQRRQRLRTKGGRGEMVHTVSYRYRRQFNITAGYKIRRSVST
jgi:hypothetical protein